MISINFHFISFRDAYCMRAFPVTDVAVVISFPSIKSRWRRVTESKDVRDRIRLSMLMMRWFFFLTCFFIDDRFGLILERFVYLFRGVGEGSGCVYL